MFTSKKVQYLDNRFNKISPITNIDSLYYEQAEKKDGKIVIHRKSFVKNMPVQFNKDFKFVNTTTYELESLSFNAVYELSNSDPHVYINTSLYTVDEHNPYDKDKNKFWYNSSLFSVVNNTYVDLHELLNHYQQLYYFDASIQNINASLSSSDTSSLDVSVEKCETIMNHLHELIYNNDKVDHEEENDIYFIDYEPRSWNTPIMSIKVQNVSINGACSQVSLDDASYYNKTYGEFHYDTASNKITYLKDEYGNEGNFDFTNSSIHYLIFDPNSNIGNIKRFVNNKLYFDPNDSSVYFTYALSYQNEYYYSNNVIYDSDKITFSKKCSNNNVHHSSGICILNGSSNKIYNSLNNATYEFVENCSVVIAGNNNVLINCNDCSINIEGNNNVLINLTNQNLNLGYNNIIIGANDTNPVPLDTSILNNTRLFFSDAARMAYEHQELCSSTILFGSDTNNVSVYTMGYASLR